MALPVPRFVLLGICLALLVTGAIAAAEPNDVAQNAWPAWRGPGGSGVAPSSSSEIPIEWTPENFLWKTEIEGLGHSSPIVWGDLVFLTTAIEGDVIPGAEPPGHKFGGQDFKHPMATAGDRHHTMKVLAVETSTGAIRWSKTAYEGRVYDDRHRDSSYASPTATTDGETVYAYFGSEGVFAYDFAGALRWKKDIGNIKSVGLGIGSSPVLFESLLIIQADEDEGEDSFILALDKRTGKQVWKRPRPVQASWTTPVIVNHKGKAQLITSGNEHVIAYDPTNGDELWRAPGLKNNAIHMPLVHESSVIFTSGYPAKVSFAIDLDQTTDLSADDPYRWRYTKGTAYVPSNVLYKGLLYLTNDGGVLTCLDAATGAVVYEGGRPGIRGRYSASLIAFDDKILMVNSDGDVAIVRAGKQFEVLATNSLDEQVTATPAISDGRIYVRGRQHLFAIGASR